MELLKGAAGTLRFPDHDGDPVEFDELPTVTVVRHSDGSAVDVGAVEKDGAGEDLVYTASVDSTATAEVDLLVATWTGKVAGADSSYTTYAEVVGGVLTSLKAIRKKQNRNQPPPDGEIAAAREAASRQIESACRCAFRPRYGREILSSDGRETLMLKHPQLQRVLSIAVDGVAWSGEELGWVTLDSSGFLGISGRWPTGRIEVAYVHGYEHFPEAAEPVRDLAAHLLATKPIDWMDRATSYSTGDATYSLITAGFRGASFPVPSVNAFVEDHQYVSVG